MRSEGAFRSEISTTACRSQAMHTMAVLVRKDGFKGSFKPPNAAAVFAQSSKVSLQLLGVIHVQGKGHGTCCRDALIK